MTNQQLNLYSVAQADAVLPAHTALYLLLGDYARYVAQGWDATLAWSWAMTSVAALDLGERDTVYFRIALEWFKGHETFVTFWLNGQHRSVRVYWLRSDKYPVCA